MSALTIHYRPELRDPVLIMAFRGWNDGAESASSVLRYLRRRAPVEPCAELDPDEFFVFSEHRPNVRNRDGTREIRWPKLDFVPLRVSGATNDLLLGLGTEPDLKWNAFATDLVELAKTLHVREVVTVGSLIADTTHTLPVPITGGATVPARAEELGLQSSGYEGPTGIVGVLGDAFRRAEIPHVSLWAGVPYYVQGGPDPRATEALLQKLNMVFNLSLNLRELDGRARRFQTQVSEAVAENPEIREYVERLERIRSRPLDSGKPLNSSEALEEVDRLLRGDPPAGSEGPPEP